MSSVDRPSDERAKYLVWTSTLSTAEAGTPSVLAIAETVIAMSISFWIAWRFQVITHILLGTLVAPLLLLRTKKSTQLTLSYLKDESWLVRCLSQIVEMAESAAYRVESLSPSWLRRAVELIALPSIVLFLGVIGCLQFLVARTLAAMICFCTDMAGALRAVPLNWMRACLCTDACYPPEVLPGSEVHATQLLQRFRFSEAVIRVLPRSEGMMELISDALFLMFIAIVLIPPYVIGIAIKSTSIVYLPFLFVINSHLGQAIKTDEFLDDQISGATERFQWWYSLFILFVMVGTVVAVTAKATLVGWVWQIEGPIFDYLRSQYLPTDGAVITIKLWHFARAANAIIIIWLYFFSQRAKDRLRASSWTNEFVRNSLELVRIVQVLLTGYVIVCSILWLWKNGSMFKTLPFQFHIQWIP